MIDEKKFTEADCAYLAGLMDQCARVKIQTQKRSTGLYQTISLRFTGLSEATSRWLLEKFGPGISVSRPLGGEITFVTRRAATICVHAYPYLIDMKAAARLVTRFATSLGQQKCPITPERLAVREEVERELRALERARGGRR